MKKVVIAMLLATFLLGLTSCGSKEAPLTEAEQAQKYGLSVEEYKEQKDAAARMNMTIDEHLNMSHGSDEKMDHSNMDMGDDSHMIEDDAEEDKGTHVMDDGSVMKDEDMHMEMMHKGEDMEEHGSGEHGDH